MAEAVTKLAVKTEMPGEKTGRSVATAEVWPFAGLRRDIDRLFDDFSGGIWRSPFGRSFFDVEPFRRAQATLGAVPAVDVTQTDKSYEITAELPGMEEKDIDVRLANGVLTIRGEKRDEKEEKKNDYYVRERSFGSFERSFQVPENVDTDKVSAYGSSTTGVDFGTKIPSSSSTFVERGSLVFRCCEGPERKNGQRQADNDQTMDLSRRAARRRLPAWNRVGRYVPCNRS